MKKEQAFILLLILFYGIRNAVAQSSFKKLSRPEKCWVVFHPVKAKKAQKVTREVQVVVDSVRKSGVIGTDNNGGNLDAFKHAYWMACLTLEIGSKQSLKLGKAHEKGNYLQYKKGRLEDAFLPDSISSEMDLRNNVFGVSVFGNCKNVSKITVQKKIMDGLANGKLTVIKKNEQGNFLTCDGAIIDLQFWEGKWGIPKCLIPLTYH